MDESTPPRPDDGRGDLPDLNILWDATYRQAADSTAATIERLTSDFRAVIQRAKAQLHDLEQMSTTMCSAVTSSIDCSDPRDNPNDAMFTLSAALLGSQRLGLALSELSALACPDHPEDLVAAVREIRGDAAA